MKNPLNSIRKSFSAMLTIWVVVFAAMIFLSSLAYISLSARRYVREESIKGANRVLDNTSLQIEAIIDDVQQAADELEWLVYRHLDSPESMLEYTRASVQGNNFLNGCAISFEPYFFKGQEYFSAYSCLVDGDVETRQEGSDDYQYFYMDWYLLPKLLNQPCWTEPYSDWEYDDEENLETDMLLSYGKPLTDYDGSFIGVISLDLSLKWLSQKLTAVQPYPHSYSVLVSRAGTFLVHPNKEKLFYETIFTPTLAGDSPFWDDLGKDFLAGKSGMRETVLKGEKNYVFYQYMPSMGWSVAIVCPEKDIFGNFNKLRNIVFSIIFLGLLFMFLVCFNVIKRSMKPLNALAEEVGKIAEGDFSQHLQQVDRIDEIGDLSRSFANMQSSLVSYIDELTATTANNERIEGELRIARAIQMGMLPNTFPPFPEREDLDLYAYMCPAKEVGGDLYDYYIVGGKLYFCIGDVSGKGIPASLFMAVTRSLFRVLAEQGMSPSEIAGRLNETIVSENKTLMFATIFIGVLDMETGFLSFCNCGHNPPVLIHKDGSAPTILTCVPNVAAGVCPGWNFEGQELPDLGDSVLFLYTDGLTEAENGVHEQFGNERLMAQLASEPFTDVMTTVKGMLDAVAGHVDGAEASDDLTILCLNYKGAEKL